MPDKINDYRDLLVWQKGISLVKEIYEITKKFPQTETFGLANQIRRAAVSIPSNIAEGQGHQYSKEFRQFLHHALGSLAEVDTQLIISQELGYITSIESIKANELIIELRKMLYSLKNKLPPR